MFLLLFGYEITLNWICFRERNICVLFLWICLRKVREFFFHQLQQILTVKYFRILCKFRVFIERFLRLLILRTVGEEKMHSKVLFLSKFPKLVSSFQFSLFTKIPLTNGRGKKSEIIISSYHIRKLQQYQEKITKTKFRLNLNRKNQKWSQNNQ